MYTILKDVRKKPAEMPDIWSLGESPLGFDGWSFPQYAGVKEHDKNIEMARAAGMTISKCKVVDVRPIVDFIVEEMSPKIGEGVDPYDFTLQILDETIDGLEWSCYTSLGAIVVPKCRCEER